MHTPERRGGSSYSPIQLRAQINESQLRMLRELEYFGWQLHFVRRPPFVEPIPVIFAGDNAYITLRFDGSLNDQPAFDVRQASSTPPPVQSHQHTADRINRPSL